MNEFLFFLTIIMNFSGILIAYKLFGKTGIFTWIGLASVVANIEVLKSIDLFGAPQALGNVIYSTTFLATDILSEKYGGKEARKGVWIGFFTLISFTLLMQINLLFTPNAQDFASDAMNTLFSIMPRICAASIIAYLFSNMLDTYLFQLIKQWQPKQLWLRNNAATMISQLIDNIIFSFVAFWGIYELKYIVALILSAYILKVIVAICDTPFLYLALKIKVAGEKDDTIRHSNSANKQEEQSANTHE